MRALKTLVIILGVMIVAATGLVVYGIVTKLGNLAGGNSDFLETFVDQIISLAPTAEVQDYVVEENRLVIRLSEQDGAGSFLIFDLSTGKQMGSIMLEQKAGE
jgi:hypothetical protein